jgi:hypothetical protein
LIFEVNTDPVCRRPRAEKTEPAGGKTKPDIWQIGKVGGGGAFVGGFGGIQLGNEKGVKIALQGPRAGMEFAANLTEVRISLK